MKSLFNYISRFVFVAFFYLVLVAPPRTAWSDDDVPKSNEPAGDSTVREIEGTSHAAISSGYRFITPIDNASAAAEYQRQKSGVIGGFSAGTVGTDLKLLADGQFLHADDYNAGLALDYAGLYKLKLDSNALWHNLERFSPATADSVTTSERDPGITYGTRTVINRASNRIKFGNNPIHLNLDYRELTREGREQLRFSDFYFDANPNSVSTRSVPVNSVTREGTFGLDAHAGALNGAYSFMIREFTNRVPEIRDLFVARDGLATGLQAHDVIHDSRVLTHTFKLYSDLSGGLTASAFYSLTKRESSSDRGDARPSGNPADTTHSAAGDMSYTPFKEFTLALKYRRLQIERESPATIYSPFARIPATPSPVYTSMAGTLLVHQASSSVRDTVILSASYRPIPKAVYRFEYQAELESRDNLSDPQATANPGALISDRRQTHTGKASFIWKPVNGVKLNATYSYATSDNPAYPNSFSERQTGQAILSYSDRGHWGGTASYLGKYESGEGGSLQARLPRESLSTSVNSTAWFTPLELMTVTASYSFLKSEIDQTSLFSSFIAAMPVQTVGNYHSTAHLYSIEALLAMTRALDLSLAFQQTFTNYGFTASDNSQNPLLSSAGIGDTSRLASTETGITTRADWHVSQHLGCSLGYSFRMYNSGQLLYDGAAHETLLAFTGRW